MEWLAVVRIALKVRSISGDQGLRLHRVLSRMPTDAQAAFEPTGYPDEHSVVEGAMVAILKPASRGKVPPFQHLSTVSEQNPF